MIIKNTKNKKEKEILLGVMNFLKAYDACLFSVLQNNILSIHLSSFKKVKYFKSEKKLSIPREFLKTAVPENIIYYILFVLSKAKILNKKRVNKFVSDTNSKEYIWDNVYVNVYD